MAKTRSLIKLKGTLGGITFVDSATYGTHSRSPRGTYTPAPVNEVLKANAERAKGITAFGKGLLLVLKAEGEGFYQRDLWQVLMKRLFAAPAADTATLVKSLPGLELHDRYPLERLVKPLPVVEAAVAKGKLAGTLSFSPPFAPGGAKGLKAYRFGAVVLWTDGARWEADPVAEGWIAVKRRTETALPFETAVPRWATHYAVLLKGEGGDGKAVEGSFSSIGMRIVGSGGVKKG